MANNPYSTDFNPLSTNNNPPGFLIQTGLSSGAANQSTADLVTAANQAKNAYKTSTNNAINQMINEYGSAYNLQAPAIQSGGYANAELNYLLGLPSLSSPTKPVQSSGMSNQQFQNEMQQYNTANSIAQQSQKLGQATSGDISGIVSNLPGFQAQLQQGTQAIQNTNSASGMLNSGNMLTALQQYGMNQESNYYNNYINQLANQSTAGNSMVNNVATNNANLGQQIGTLQTNLGTNNANADLAIGQAQSQGVLSQLGSYKNQYVPTIDPQYSQAQAANQFGVQQAQAQNTANQLYNINGAAISGLGEAAYGK